MHSHMHGRTYSSAHAQTHFVRPTHTRMHALAPSVINDDCELHDMMVVYIRRHVMTDDRRLEALPKTKESRALQYISL